MVRPRADALRPINPPEPPKPTEYDSPALASKTASIGLGTVVYVFIALVIAAAIAAIVWFMRKYLSEPIPDVPRLPSRSARVFGPLPLGLEVNDQNPWNAAERAHAAGDYGKAILYLFAYELFALDELRLIRLAPGKTCRQLVRGVGEDKARGWVEPALRLFEAAYYGRRPPAGEAFEHAWRLAGELRAHIASKGMIK